MSAAVLLPWQRLLMATGRTHCRRGHRFTPETTRWEHAKRGRHCRVCETENQRQRRAAA